MSRTKNAAELCALIVDDIYGELASRIFAILLRRGRLPISVLAQHSKLPSRHVRHGLSVLVQQNLAYHLLDNDTNITYYEANQDAAYALLRSGKIMDIVNSRFGNTAKDLVQNLLQLGHAKIGDVVDAYEMNKSAAKLHNKGHANGNGTSNGTNGNHELEKLDEVLSRLLESGLVEPVVGSMFRSPTDTYNIAEKKLIKENFGGSIKGAKQKDELKRMLAEHLRELRSEGRGWDASRGIKRTANGDHVNGSEKRRKLTNGHGLVNGDSNGNSDDTFGLDRNLIIRINYEKCTVALRSQSFVALAEHDFGKTTAQVYAALLRLLEDKILRCRLDPTIDDLDEDHDRASASTMEISLALSKFVDVSKGIGKAPEDKIDTRSLENSKGKRRNGSDEAEVDSGASSDEDEDDDEDGDDVNKNGNIMEIDEDSDTMMDDPFTDAAVQPRPSKVTFQDKLPKPASSEDRQNRMLMIKKHLMLLSEHSHCFVRNCGSRGMGEWTVDFEALVDYMRETHLDTVIAQDFGKIGLRVTRVLKEKGKLDEKTIPSFALLKQKDVRTKLVEMQMAGYIDIQEVPRDNSRAPGRTIFLWFFDKERVSLITLDKLYKSIARSLEVLEVEKIKEQDVLGLAERSDVRENEEEMLSKEQKKNLREIREKEERIMAQISRLDDLVGVFRDY